eukprot:TRINITY_DN878_c0_g4_i2.p1 TRINITY_DN878_c0_g4~~TRINITY_DN878_c0_g4_i2.p1  ORF type:complete len:2045 (-),score=389.67 TRINITY_DN878_c0_g4_i2:678-6179(-)
MGSPPAVHGIKYGRGPRSPLGSGQLASAFDSYSDAGGNDGAFSDSGECRPSRREMNRPAELSMHGVDRDAAARFAAGHARRTSMGGMDSPQAVRSSGAPLELKRALTGDSRGAVTRGRGSYTRSTSHEDSMSDTGGPGDFERPGPSGWAPMGSGGLQPKRTPPRLHEPRGHGRAPSGGKPVGNILEGVMSKASHSEGGGGEVPGPSPANSLSFLASLPPLKAPSGGPASSLVRASSGIDPSDIVRPTLTRGITEVHREVPSYGQKAPLARKPLVTKVAVRKGDTGASGSIPPSPAAGSRTREMAPPLGQDAGSHSSRGLDANSGSTPRASTGQMAGEPPSPFAPDIAGDLRTDLLAAEAAIEALQEESIAWEQASRNLSREVESLRLQLTDQDRQSEIEIQQLISERDRLKRQVDKLRGVQVASEDEEDMHEAARWDLEEARRNMGELLEEVELQKEQVDSLTLQCHKLQEANNELQGAVLDAETALESYKKDLEELYEGNNERDAALKKAQIALETSEREWSDKMQTLRDAHNALEQKYKAMEPAEVTIRVGKGAETFADQSATITALQQKIDEMESEAEELTTESLQLAANLTKLTKESEAKTLTIERLQNDLERVKGPHSATTTTTIFGSWGSSAKSSEAKQGQGTPPGSSSTGLPAHSRSLSTEDASRMKSPSNSFVSGMIDTPLSSTSPSSLFEITRLKGQMATLERELRDVKEERDELAAAVAATTSSGGTCGPAGAAVEGGMPGVAAAAAVAHGATDDLEVHKLKNQLRLSEMATKRAQDRVSVLEAVQSRVIELESELRAKKEEITRLGKSRGEWEGGVKAQLESLAAEKREFDKKLGTAYDQLSAKEKALAELQAEKVAMMTKISELTGSRKKAELSASTVGAQNAELTQEVRSLGDQLRSATEKAAVLEEDLKKAVADVNDAKRKATADNLSLATAKEELEGRVHELSEENQNMQVQMRILEERSALDRSARQELELQLSAVEEEFAAAKEYSNSVGASSKTSAELTTARSELKASTRRAAELEGEVHSLRERLEREKSEAAAAVAEAGAAARKAKEEWDEIRQELELELQELDSGKGVLSQRVLSLEKDVAKLTGQVEASRTARWQAEAGVTELQGALAEKEQELLQAHERVQDREERIERLEARNLLHGDSEKASEAARTDLEQEVQTLRRKLERHVEREQALLSQLADIDALHETVAKLGEDHRRITDVQQDTAGQLAAARSERQSAVEEVEALRETLREERELFEAEAQDLREHLERREEESERLRSDTPGLTERLRVGLDRLTDEISLIMKGDEKAGRHALLEASDLRTQIVKFGEMLSRSGAKFVGSGDEKREGAAALGVQNAKSLDRDLSSRSEREQQLLQEVERAKGTAAALRDAAKTIDALRSERDILTASLSECQSSLERMALELRHVKAERKGGFDQSAALQDIRALFEQTKAEVVRLKGVKTNLEDQRKTLTERLALAEQDRMSADELMTRVSDLERERDALSALVQKGDESRLHAMESKGLPATPGKQRAIQAERLATRAAAVIAEDAADLKMANAELRRLVAEQAAELEAAAELKVLNVELQRVAAEQKTHIDSLVAANGGAGTTTSGADLLRTMSMEGTGFKFPRGRSEPYGNASDFPPTDVPAPPPQHSSFGRSTSSGPLAPVAPYGGRIGGGKMGGIMAAPKDRGDSAKQIDDLRRKMIALEEELQRKVEALSIAERKLAERETGGGGSHRMQNTGGAASREWRDAPRHRNAEDDMDAMSRRENGLREKERLFQEKLNGLSHEAGSDYEEFPERSQQRRTPRGFGKEQQAKSAFHHRSSSSSQAHL